MSSYPPSPITIREAQRLGRQMFREARIESPGLDADLILMHTLNLDRIRIIIDRDQPLTPTQMDEFHRALERRCNGIPVAYITGEREFYGLTFKVNADVLVPRPETEYLVEWALSRRTREHSSHNPRKIIDVGTGSGAIAVSIGHHIQETNDLVLASDVSEGALVIADRNRRQHAGENVHLIRGDLLSWFHGEADLILANLPYLHPDQAHSGIAAEPEIALFVPVDGFGLYDAFLPQAAECLKSDGAIICELDPRISERAMTRSQECFPEHQVHIQSDLAGTDRYLVIEPH